MDTCICSRLILAQLEAEVRNQLKHCWFCTAGVLVGRWLRCAVITTRSRSLNANCENWIPLSSMFGLHERVWLIFALMVVDGKSETAAQFHIVGKVLQNNWFGLIVGKLGTCHQPGHLPITTKWERCAKIIFSYNHKLHCTFLFRPPQVAMNQMFNARSQANVHECLIQFSG